VEDKTEGEKMKTFKLVSVLSLCLLALTAFAIGELAGGVSLLGAAVTTASV
jgi:hypothetical protein